MSDHFPLSELKIAMIARKLTCYFRKPNLSELLACCQPRSHSDRAKRIDFNYLPQKNKLAYRYFGSSPNSALFVCPLTRRVMRILLMVTDFQGRRAMNINQEHCSLEF